MTQYSVLSTKTPLLSRTPLHHWHATHGARFSERDGWLLPEVYTSVDEELNAARTGAGMADISAFAKLSLHGDGVVAVTPQLVGNESASRPGSVARLAADSSVLACRLAADQLLLLAADPRMDAIERSLAEIRGIPGIVRHDQTTGFAGFTLVGTATELVLRHLTSFDDSQNGLPSGTCAQTSLASVHALIVRPPGAVASSHIYVASDLAEHVWLALLSAGKPCGLRAIGLDAFEQASRAK